MSYDTTRARAHNFVDLTGKRFGRWTVLHEVPKPEHVKTKQLVSYWLCRCDCGTTRAVISQSLRSGASQSCGCKNLEDIRARKVKHDMTDTVEYQIWCAIKARCHNPNHRSYSNYGGRGITICASWDKSFAAFIEDVGFRPGPEYSLDRIDNSGPYAPGNVRWATSFEQGSNKRNNLWLTYQGKTQTLTQWAREFGIHVSTVINRYRRGCPAEDILLPGRLPSSKWQRHT